MTSEWSHLVHDGSHSIQNTETGSDLTTNDERASLLPNRHSPCIRNLWITFFIIFLSIGFVTGAYLLFTEEIEWPIVPTNYSLITRSDWRAKAVTETIPELQVPIERILLTKTNTPECKNETECIQEINKVQSHHVNSLQEPDIAYNFLIAGDGQTYEGRGWNYQAMISKSKENHTLVVAFLGIFNNSLPSEKQINQAKSFLQVAENKGKLTPCYSIEEQNSEQSQGFLTYVISHLKKYFKKRHKEC